MFEMFLASTLLSAGGSILGGNAEREAVNDKANEVLRAAGEHTKIVGEEGKRTVGKQEADTGAAGLQLKGSTLENTIETLAHTFREQESIMASARSEARSLRKSGKSAQRAGWMSAIGTIGSAVPGAKQLKPNL